MKNLIKYELTDEGKKHLPKEGPVSRENRGAKLIIAGNKKGDPYFEGYLSTLTDYQAQALLDRKDGRGAKYVKLKSSAKSSSSGTSGSQKKTGEKI